MSVHGSHTLFVECVVACTHARRSLPSLPCAGETSAQALRFCLDERWRTLQPSWSTGTGTSGGPALAVYECKADRSRHFVGTVALGAARARNAIKQQLPSSNEWYSFHLSVLLMLHNRVADFCVWQGHDAFCDALHLDQAVLPVSLVVHPVTGAQRVITQGMVTAFCITITKPADVR